MDSQHMFVVAEHALPDRPRAVVLILGWWGSEMRHLSKYADLYHGMDCITVQVIASSRAIFTHDNKSLDDCAMMAASHVAKLLLAYADHCSHLPVIIHCFSNGGSFVLERLETLMEQARVAHKSGDDRLSSRRQKDLLLFAERLVGEIFDSAPGYPSAETAIRAISGVFRNNFIRMLMLTLFGIYYVMSRLFHNILLRGPDLGDQFWNHMRESRICLQQAYIYSKADTVIDKEHLDELIEHRKTIGCDVTVLCFTDSIHVQHMRKHPAAYKKLIDDCLEKWILIGKHQKNTK